MCKEVTWL